MEQILPSSFSDFPEDVQLCILSWLHQSELQAFAYTSKNFFTLCNNDERLWFLKCSRRWGSQTRIKKWGGGKISYRNLFHLLNYYESLIGFWNYDYYDRRYASSSQLLLFEWGLFYITGYRVFPSKCGGYDVVKKPFLWITATSDGQTLNYLDMTETLSLTENDLSCEDSEKLRSPGLILVDIDLSEDRCLKLRENRQFLELRKLLDTGSGGEDQYEIVYRSPPDGLMRQIYEILPSKPSSKKEKWRARRRVRRWHTESFLKIMNLFPTPSRPLQGLWKGIGPKKSLNLYLVSYREDRDYICCVVVGSDSTPRFFCEPIFSTRTTAFAEFPLSFEEEHAYNTRPHLRPVAKSNQSGQDRATPFQDEDLDVSRMCYAFSPHYPYHRGSFEHPDGRVWLYADGTFGFGFLRDDYIVDLKPVVKNGRLIDAI
ncbi:F-box protein At3g12350-like [Primulina tabacum]|uniref:F-box protein At3g12350-like n=1 Tax=Primulina tabacum TaxID=48773 RepID=UPI003F5A77BF